MAFTQVTITGNLSDPSGTPIQGTRIEFTLSQSLFDSSSGAMVATSPKTVSTDTSGNFSIVLSATNDATTYPRGQVYCARFLIAGAEAQTQFGVNTSFPVYYFALPNTAAPTISFANLVYSPSLQNGIYDNSTNGIVIQESGVSTVSVIGAHGVNITDSSSTGISLTASPIKLSSGTTAIKVYTAATVATLPTSGITAGSFAITADYRTRFWNGSAWIAGS